MNFRGPDATKPDELAMGERFGSPAKSHREERGDLSEVGALRKLRPVAGKLGQSPRIDLPA